MPAGITLATPSVDETQFMARHKLSDPSQPFAVRAVLSIYEFLASLKLAVVLILLLAIVLGTATFVEANYGTAAVGFLIYHRWYFAALLSLLALNIFCAAAIRFPWKRHQTGFVITHIGLLTLLAGSAISDRGSVNSQLLVFLNDSNHVAIDMDQSRLTVADIPGRPEPLQVRFQPGPFNWSDLAPYPFVRRIKSWVGLDDPAKSWQHAPQVLYDDGKTSVEVVDFYSRSAVHTVPYLALNFAVPAFKVDIPVELEMDERSSPMAEGALGMMGKVYMWRSNEDDALTAFKDCKPDRTVEGEGVVCFYWKGETYTASVRELQKLKDQGKPYVLTDGLTVELGGFVESADLEALIHGNKLAPLAPGADVHGLGPTVELLVHEKNHGQETNYRVMRFAQLPYMPQAKHPPGFHAEFFHPSVQGQVDILISPDGKLAYRAWQQKVGRVVASGDLEVGKTVETFSMGGGERVMKMTALRYIPQASSIEGERTTSEVVVPLPFDKGDRGETRRVQLRVSWTDPGSGSRKHDTFWLKQNLPEPWENPKRQQVHETNVGEAKPIRTAYSVKETPVGFTLKLVDFDLEVDPGTKMAANYTSHVVQVDVRNESDVRRLRTAIDEARDPAQRQTSREELASTVQSRTDALLEVLKGKTGKEREKIVNEHESTLSDFLITMNKPLDYPDLDGRQLRFFQENYLAPDKARGTPLGSILRVNYDPGRPVKYLGSGLIVFGIFLMFYMRAYFFKRPGSSTHVEGATS